MAARDTSRKLCMRAQFCTHAQLPQAQHPQFELARMHNLPPKCWHACTMLARGWYACTISGTHVPLSIYTSVQLSVRKEAVLPLLVRPHMVLDRCRAIMAHIRQPRPDSGLAMTVKVFKTFEVVPSSLGSGWRSGGNSLCRGT